MDALTLSGNEPEFKRLKLVVRLITGKAWITAIFRAVKLMETELQNGENAGERENKVMHFGPNMSPIVWLAQLLWHMFERHLTFHSSPPHKTPTHLQQRRQAAEALAFHLPLGIFQTVVAQGWTVQVHSVRGRHRKPSRTVTVLSSTSQYKAG